ncbi:AAA family ATPase [Nonomuraea sp. NN258]|uniref:ATP-binding protein n=1 Tax=Nonomuraea antri TaxID=2730852 RepID=UPI00156848C6|nr:LuxR family transcriptional regulator [Nonomuraea antri]NRQ36327.1 AAA family ATPase [Nonomuraea antri]
MATVPRRRQAGSLRTTSPVLVGRARELESLAVTLSGPPAVAMIEGEAGVGKSRLVRELTAQPVLRRLRLLQGQCQSPREPFLYGAVLEALGQLSGVAFAGLSPVTGVLRPLLPELSDVLPEPPEPAGDPRSERHRMFRAIRELLSAAGPALLVVEDLHWADDGTRHLLRFLMADPLPNLGVALTYRREEVPGGVPLGAAYRPPPGVASVLIGLEPLERAEVRQLAAAILGESHISAEFAAKLHERTAGLPFVVEETLRTLRTSAGDVHLDGAVARQLLEHVEVPVLLREAMAERLAAMPLPAVRLAQAAAVLAVPATAELLHLMTGLTGQRARSALAAALAAGVLRESGYTYGFRHALAQQAVYDTLAGFDRGRLHARALRVLEQQRPQPLVQLAEHAYQAGFDDEALRYGELAADRSAEIGDASTATHLLQRLLRRAALPTRDVDRLAIKLGQVAQTGLDQLDPSATLEGLLRDERLSTAVRGEVRLSLGLMLIRQRGSLQAGRAAIHSALDELDERPHLRAKGIAVLAQPYFGTTPVGDLRGWTDQVRGLVGTFTGEPRVSLLANHLASLLHTGDPAVLPGLALPEPALPDAPASAGERRQLARAHCNLADACTCIGHFHRARSLLNSGLRLAADAGPTFVVSTARSTGARLDWFLGDWDGLAERAADLLDEYHDLFPVASELSLVLGLLAIVRGEWEEAESRLAATGVANPADAITPVALGGYAALASLRLARGEHDGALTEIDRGLRLARGKGVWAWTGELVPVAVAALLAGGRPGEAADLLADLAAGLADLDAPLAAAALAHGRAQLLHHRGDLSGAVEAYEAARRRYARLPAPYHQALVEEQIALCSGSADHLSVLADTFTAMGAARDADRCRYRLRGYGVPPSSRRGRRGYGNLLSPREQDVARLLARGRTNREIAEVLFLSPRTVEQHVAKVLRKLGKESRTDLMDDRRP